MACLITVFPSGKQLRAEYGSNLLAVLRQAGLGPDAPCGGEGRCGKCRVSVDGQELLACRVRVERDMTVTVPEDAEAVCLAEGIRVAAAGGEYALAFDIGTTTVAGCLLAPDGTGLASESLRNPQGAFGADVISRIRHGLDGHMEALTAAVRTALEQLTVHLCRQGGVEPQTVKTVSVVGNPTMQQLFLGLRPDNLSRPPYEPVLTRLQLTEAGDILPLWAGARLLTVPDISGFVGADTLACVLATNQHRQMEPTLLVDIGTNGEMVLGSRRGLIACSTAAGPALEGAGISCGMGARKGAIDHVRWEDGRLHCHVIGGGEAQGICGSGLIDAVAAALDAGWLNQRGKLIHGEDRIHLTGPVFLTQEDIRQVQAAKGAIAAGIRRMLQVLQLQEAEVARVDLAGAFGTFLEPKAACRIGLIPAGLEGRVRAVGNAALSGARLLACDDTVRKEAARLVGTIRHLDLSTDPGFPRCFAENMRFVP